ncbi:hypothetical protein R5R35_012526 [Gryllus longicercus]|uniref:Uncharacterized protein n=1 Tax=Gryllus longicercus TaxID=2509291 RepID=A0AAN9V9L3_9ORTH
MKMALRTQQGFEDDDDEDLKALRLAALQTLKAKPTSPQNAPTQWVAPVISPQSEASSLPPVAHRPRNDYNRGGMHRGRHMRNGPFIRHRVNPNLIAIVPIKQPSPPPNSTSDQSTCKVAKSALVVNSSSPKLVLPQDRYCKTEDVSKEKEPEVSTKFDRFEHSSSESSAEESAEEEEEEAEENVGAGEKAIKTEAEAVVAVAGASDAEPDPDVLLVKDEDEDDSLEKLMNEMEEEMATDVLRPRVTITSKAKARKEAAAPAPTPTPATESVAAPAQASAPARRQRPHKEKASKKNRAAAAAVREDQARQQSPDTCTTTLPSAAARAPSPAPAPTDRLGRPPQQPSPPGQRHSPPSRPHPHARPHPHPRAASPRPRTRSRSRSPPRSPALLRAHRSRSVSPPPARHKPHFSPGRSRSRSRSPRSLSPRSRSPRSRSPRSPPLHRARSRSPRSRTRSPPPRRKYSPGAPRAGSPLRRARLSPPRRASPAGLRWASPRRQSISPKFRRQSVSPGGRRVSPGPGYRRNQRSPSPTRLRNLSPPPPAPAAGRRYSPPRRNPSPPPPARRRAGSRSPPSPRRRPRLRPLSPAGAAGRKASPWSPGALRGPAAGRPTPPAYARKSPPSPAYARGRRRSDSPPPPRRAADADKGLYRAPSPLRGRRPLQESRLNNIRRSCSPAGDCPLLGRRASPPPSPAPSATPPSPSDKNWSCTSSLSLSPSPERAGEGAHRVKSPLRPLRVRKRHPADFVGGGGGAMYAEAVAGGRAQMAAAAVVASAVDESARKLKRRKDRSRSKKRARVRGVEDAAAAAARARDRAEPPPSATATASTDSSNFSAAWEAANSVLEARRRKFESSVPIESSNKRIRLKKPPLAEPGCGRLEEEDRNRAPSQPAAAVEPLLMATDDLEEILDLELENAMQLWSDDESNSDNEARFKSTEKVAAPTEMPRIRVVPLAKLQGLDSGTKEKPEKGKSRPVSGDEQEHSLHTSVRDVSRKSSRSSRGQEQLSLKEDTLEAQICPPSDALELDQKRSKIRVAAADNLDDLEETGDGSKDGDLRAELSRRRAERLTMAGSVHETLPARLVQSAFKDAVGKKNFRRLDRERHGSSKRPDSQKGTEAGDGRRVLVLKSSAVEQQIPSISVTIPKEEKHKRGGSPVSGGKVPIRMRLGLPGGGSSFPEERERPSGGRRRSSRKVKLKRNVLLASPAGEKV